jgi:hypothetical protein
VASGRVPANYIQVDKDDPAQIARQTAAHYRSRIPWALAK